MTKEEKRGRKEERKVKGLDNGMKYRRRHIYMKRKGRAEKIKETKKTDEKAKLKE